MRWCFAVSARASLISSDPRRFDRAPQRHACERLQRAGIGPLTMFSGRGPDSDLGELCPRWIAISEEVGIGSVHATGTLIPETIFVASSGTSLC